MLQHNKFLTKYKTVSVSQPPHTLDLAPTDSVLQNKRYTKEMDIS